MSQLEVLWSKMHQVRLFAAEAQAHEEELTTDQERSRVVQGDERFQTFRLLTKEKQTGNVADAKDSNAAQCENEETKSKSIAHTNTGRVARPTSAWKASYWGCEDSEDDSDDSVGEQGATAHRQLDEANGAAIPAMKSGQMMRRTRSGASCIVTMTMIVRTIW